MHNPGHAKNLNVIAGNALSSTIDHRFLALLETAEKVRKGRLYPMPSLAKDHENLMLCAVVHKRDGSGAGQ